VGTPDQARSALDLGAQAVVGGTAITRPIDIVQRFASVMAGSSCGRVAVESG
jgi:putative N-acetylmannosamine-6-phosphate epimerase